MELPEPCDERVPQMEVRIDGDMAHAWGRYTFRVGTRLTNCGRKLVSAAPHGQRMEDHPHRLTIETTGCVALYVARLS